VASAILRRLPGFGSRGEAGSRRGRGADSKRAAAPQVERQALVNTGWEAPLLLVIALLLFSFGLVTVYSASAFRAQAMGLEDYHFVLRQATGGAIGLLLLAVMARLDYRRLRLMAWPLLFVVIALLALTVAPGTESIAPRVNGARRWLHLGPLAIQPSEFAKFAVITWTAMLAVRKQEKLPSLSRGLLPFLLVWGLVLLLIFLQPNLSAAALIVLLASLVVFAGGARIGHFLLLGAITLPLLWSTVEGVAYRMRRVVSFLDPTHDPAGMSYQINQALIAMGSGGIMGRGFGHGQQKFGFLPEPYNDFIYAMIGEEWGVLGTMGVLLLFTAFLLTGYRVARNAPDLFGFLLAIGLTNLIAVQALLHMAVNTALIPTTGIVLPFVSYGRSSLFVCMMAVGVLVNIARQGERRTVE
jgi:cell division protein FtsW